MPAHARKQAGPTDLAIVARRAWRGWRRSRPFWGAIVSLTAGVETAAVRYSQPIHSTWTILPAGLIIAAAMVTCGLLLLFDPTQRSLYSVLGILLAISALKTAHLGGYLIGTLLGLAGGAVAFAWVPNLPAAPPPAAPAGFTLILGEAGRRERGQARPALRGTAARPGSRPERHADWPYGPQPVRVRERGPGRHSGARPTPQPGRRPASPPARPQAAPQPVPPQPAPRHAAAWPPMSAPGPWRDAQQDTGPVTGPVTEPGWWPGGTGQPGVEPGGWRGAEPPDAAPWSPDSGLLADTRPDDWRSHEPSWLRDTRPGGEPDRLAPPPAPGPSLMSDAGADEPAWVSQTLPGRAVGSRQLIPVQSDQQQWEPARLPRRRPPVSRRPVRPDRQLGWQSARDRDQD